MAVVRFVSSISRPGDVFAGLELDAFVRHVLAVQPDLLEDPALGQVRRRGRRAGPMSPSTSNAPVSLMFDPPNIGIGLLSTSAGGAVTRMRGEPFGLRGGAEGDRARHLCAARADDNHARDVFAGHVDRCNGELALLLGEWRARIHRSGT